MACRTADELTDLQNDLTVTLAQIVALSAAIVNGPMSGTISYTFGSSGGTGIQKEVFMSAMEANNAMGGLMARRNRLRRALSGQSLSSLRLRR